MKNITLLLFLLAFSVSSIVQAKVFRNAYIAFEMPDDWNCTLEQTEWVCRSSKEPDSKEAIIILTAKEVGPTDSFPLYETHLNSSIAIGATQQASQSKVVYKAKKVQIRDHQWLDGLHQGSEVSNYYTRYLATIKNKIAVLVTFSAHTKYYSKYSTMFHNAIMSMNIIASRDLLAKSEFGPIRGGEGTLGPGTIQPAMPMDLYQSEGSSGKNNNMGMILGLLLIVGSIVGFFLYKKNS
jgi:hypothetical protein